MINIGEKPIEAMMIGEMGIKNAYLGETKVYERSGGYFYLELTTKGEITNV